MAKRNLIAIIFINVLLFFALIFLNNKPNTLLLAYLAAGVILIFPNPPDWKLFILASASAVLVEIVAVNYNIWSYPETYRLGAPWWIFIMWGVGAVSAFRIGLYLNQKQ